MRRWAGSFWLYAVAVLTVAVVAGCGTGANPPGSAMPDASPTATASDTGPATPTPTAAVTTTTPPSTATPSPPPSGASSADPTPTGSPSADPTPTGSPSPHPTPTGSPSADPTTTGSPPAGSLQTLQRGDSGPAVLRLQRDLSALGYWLGRPDGDFGELTEQAVLALQGAAGLARDGIVGRKTHAALTAGTQPQPRTEMGRALEVDRDAGLLIFARGGNPALVLHTSTGTFEPYVYEGNQFLADTPAGRWEVSWAHDGWRNADLGRLYRPRYFHDDGIAVHGYSSVPAYPASHGCARVTIPAMDMIWRESLMPLGATVLVY